MILGNSGGNNKDKKYLKIKSYKDQNIVGENKYIKFNKWISKNYEILSKRIISKYSFLDEDVFQDTYIKISNLLLYKENFDIKDFNSYFHRAYFTIFMQIEFNKNKINKVDIDEIDIIDEIKIKEKMEKEKLEDKIITWIEDNFDTTNVNLFKKNILDRITYKELSKIYNISEKEIAKKIVSLKNKVKEEFTEYQVYFPIGKGAKLKVKEGKVTSVTKKLKQLNKPFFFNKKDKHLSTDINSIETEDIWVDAKVDSIKNEAEIILNLIEQKRVVPYSLYLDLQDKLIKAKAKLLSYEK